MFLRLPLMHLRIGKLLTLGTLELIFHRELLLERLKI